MIRLLDVRAEIELSCQYSQLNHLPMRLVFLFVVFLNRKLMKVKNDTISKEHEKTYINSRSANSSALEEPCRSTNQFEKPFGG